MAKEKAGKAAKPAKPVTRRTVVGNTAAAVGLLGVAGAGNVAADAFSSFLDKYLGGGETTVTAVEGSEDWDTDYYDSEYRGRNAATVAAEELVVELEAEGAVLLKNDGVLPLASGTSISLLGRYAADPVYGGSGSGTVDADSCITFYAGLTNAGLAVNDTAFDWISSNYSSYDKADITMDKPATATYYIGEIPWDDYSSDAQASIAGTTAVVVLGRGGGEGGDLSRDLLGDLNSGVSSNFTANSETANYVEGQHELELTVEEESLLAAAKASCDALVVIVNSSTPMELGPIAEGGAYEADAILLVGSIGASGATAVGQILTGEVNPSGRTCDIWPADFEADPTFYNFGGKNYTDVADYYPNSSSTASEGTAYFVEYKEGVYMGYRYYETAGVEAEAGNYDGFDYDSAVVFPFGYGLSYTEFTETLDSVEASDETVVATVTVTNAGSVAGKDVVEIYYSAPYTEGGIEKPAVVLGAFAKTSSLEAGASETLELSFAVRDMASWSSAEGCYVLDEGDYVVSLRSDSHTVIDEVTLSFAATQYTTDATTGAELANRFDDLTEYMERNYTPFSRADFAGTFPTAAEDTTTSAVGITLEEYDYTQDLDDSVEMPTTGADNGLSLIDMRGLDFDDEAWDSLLDQLSVDDMTSMLNDGAYNTAAIDSIGKPATSEPDGPAGFTSLNGSTGNCAYCSETVMAQTWNTDLMREMGLMIGQEALASGYNGWYAPAVNTHRSPFGGRNFEYYSEDPLLGGKIAAAVVGGAAQNGVYALVKHFALNDQDSYRVQHVCMWANEQSMREIYLRQFELAVKEPTYEIKYISDDEGTVSTREMQGCTGVMSSYNYLGTTWAGGCRALCTEILRDEWGFEGFVITDFNLYEFMKKNQALHAGTDLHLTYSAMTEAFSGTSEGSVVADLREAVHRVCYTVVNSNAMQGVAPGSTITTSAAPWQYGVWGASAVLVAGAAFFGYRAVRAGGKLKEQKAAAAEAEAEPGPEE